MVCIKILRVNNFYTNFGCIWMSIRQTNVLSSVGRITLSKIATYWVYFRQLSGSTAPETIRCIMKPADASKFFDAVKLTDADFVSIVCINTDMFCIYIRYCLQH